jgi:hypothetical protein
MMGDPRNQRRWKEWKTKASKAEWLQNVGMSLMGQIYQHWNIILGYKA